MWLLEIRPMLAPQDGSDLRPVRLQLEFRDQLEIQSIIAHFQRTLRSLTDPPLPAVLLASRHGSPLDQNLVDIHEHTAVNSEGIVIVELCSGLCATTEALAYTLEDAIVVANLDLFAALPGIGLIAKFRAAIANSADFAALSAALKEALKGGNKAEFALDLLEIETPAHLKPPKYIREGLLWLAKQARA